MKYLKFVLVISFAFSLFACMEKKPKMDNLKAKYSYAIGHQIAKNMKNQNVELDQVAFSAAVKDVMAGKDPLIDEKTMRESLQEMSKARQSKEKEGAKANLEKGKKYLEENKQKEGVKVTESGLQYRVITEGKGKKPTAKDKVSVHYKGTLIDGKEFDSSYKRNSPAEFPVMGVIKGWQEGLQLMTVGSKYEFVIPADLAYGERGNPSIPGNSVLVFEVELLEILDK